MSDLTTETARALAEGRLEDALTLAEAAETIHNALTEHAARQIAYYTERFLNCQARGLDLRDVEAPPDGWSEPAPACDVQVSDAEYQTTRCGNTAVYRLVNGSERVCQFHRDGAVAIAPHTARDFEAVGSTGL